MYIVSPPPRRRSARLSGRGYRGCLAEDYLAAASSARPADSVRPGQPNEPPPESRHAPVPPVMVRPARATATDDATRRTEGQAGDARGRGTVGDSGDWGMEGWRHGGQAGGGDRRYRNTTLTSNHTQVPDAASDHTQAQCQRCMSVSGKDNRTRYWEIDVGKSNRKTTCSQLICIVKTIAECTSNSRMMALAAGARIA